MISKLQVNNSIHAFLYSPYYLIMMGAITYLGWMLDQSAIGMAILLIIGGLSLLVNRDFLPVIPAIAFPIFCPSSMDFMDHKTNLIIVVAGACFMSVCFIAHFILFRPKFKLFKLTIPLIMVSVALFAGGLGSISVDSYVSSFAFILALGPLMLLFYYIMMLYFCPTPDVDARKYVCIIMTVLAAILCGEVITFIVRFEKPLIDLIRDPFILGWGNRNTVGLIFTLTIPLTFYLAYCKKHVMAICLYLFAIIQYTLIAIMFTRSGLISCTFVLTLSIIYTFWKGKNKSSLIYAIAIIFALVSIFALMNPDIINAIIMKFKDMANMDSTGRIELYIEAFKLFLADPIFGVGLGYVGNITHKPEFAIYWFHSTIMQVIGSMGIIGIIAYTTLYISRGIQLFKNFSNFNMLLAIAIIGFEAICLIESGTFLPFPTLFLSIFLTAFLEFSNAQESPSTDTIRLVREPITIN